MPQLQVIVNHPHLHHMDQILWVKKFIQLCVFGKSDSLVGESVNAKQCPKQWMLQKAVIGPSQCIKIAVHYEFGE